jgi:hypothetical protein
MARSLSDRSSVWPEWAKRRANDYIKYATGIESDATRGGKESTISEREKNLRPSLMFATEPNPNTGHVPKESPDRTESVHDGRTNAPTETLGLGRESQKYLIPALGAKYIAGMVRGFFDDDSGL